MKKFLFFLCNLPLFLFSQQWDWAVTADSVYGNQQTKQLCRNGNDLYVLLHQDGKSVIGGNHLDTGTVIVKLNTSGQILWAKNYPLPLRSLWAGYDGNLYFIGEFTGIAHVYISTLVTNGGRDIFFGALDGSSGNPLWINSIGGYNDDRGNTICIDSSDHLFIGGQIKDDFYANHSYVSGLIGTYTYLVRCDFVGNYIQSFHDSSPNMNTGLNFKIDPQGTVHLSTLSNTDNCPYICWGTHVFRIDPQNLSPTLTATLNTYETLHSWDVNADNTYTLNYNTGSHYMTTTDVFRVSQNNGASQLRKSMGNGYDGKSTPYLVNGTGKETIMSGYVLKPWGNNHRDTVWYDSFPVLTDSMFNTVLLGFDTLNQINWLLRSYGHGVTVPKGIESDHLGHAYVAGEFNSHAEWYNPPDPSPKNVSFGTYTLTAQGSNSSFFVVGASSGQAIYVSGNLPVPVALVFYPNPSSGKISFSHDMPLNAVSVYNSLGAKVGCNTCVRELDLSGQSAGVYFAEYECNGMRTVKKIVLEK